MPWDWLRSIEKTLSPYLTILTILTSLNLCDAGVSQQSCEDHCVSQESDTSKCRELRELRDSWRLSETSDIMRTNLACHAFSCLAVYSVSSLYVDLLTSHSSYRIAMHCSCFFAMPILFLWGASSEGRPKAMASTVWGSISAQRWSQQYSAKLKNLAVSCSHVFAKVRLCWRCCQQFCMSWAQFWLCGCRTFDSSDFYQKAQKCHCLSLPWVFSYVDRHRPVGPIWKETDW